MPLYREDRLRNVLVPYIKSVAFPEKFAVTVTNRADVQKVPVEHILLFLLQWQTSIVSAICADLPIGHDLFTIQTNMLKMIDQLKKSPELLSNPFAEKGEEEDEEDDLSFLLERNRGFGASGEGFGQPPTRQEAPAETPQMEARHEGGLIDRLRRQSVDRAIATEGDAPPMVVNPSCGNDGDPSAREVPEKSEEADPNISDSGVVLPATPSSANEGGEDNPLNSGDGQ